METFRVLEVVTKVYAFNVKAENKQEALDRINKSFGGETEYIKRCSEYDKEVFRDYEIEE